MLDDMIPLLCDPQRAAESCSKVPVAGHFNRSTWQTVQTRHYASAA